MPTYTTNYNLAKPLVNSAVDQDLWGDELNNDMDIIDSTMKSISDSVAAVLATVYPIGSYYINETNSTNPGTLFGFGTWVAVTDKFIVGHGSTYTTTGGAATVTLTANNLPALSAVGKYWNSGNPTGGNGFTKTDSFSGGYTLSDTTTTISNAVNSGSPNSSFSIIPPYQAAYIWKRTA